MIAPLVHKFRLFPFRSRINDIARKFSRTVLCHLWVRWFSCPFESLKPYIPPQGVIYDLGCGHGLMLQMLDACLPENVTLAGFDIDQRKIDIAAGLNRSVRTSYNVRDITDDLGVCDLSGIILNDTLHLLGWSEQENLLRRCHDYLARRGVLLIKEIERRPAWKFHWSRFQEKLVNDVFHLTQGAGLYYRSRASWLEILGKTGFQVEVIPAHQGYPYSHIIYHCHKVQP